MSDLSMATLSDVERRAVAHTIEEYLKARPKLSEGGTGAAYASILRSALGKLRPGPDVVTELRADCEGRGVRIVVEAADV